MEAQLQDINNSTTLTSLKQLRGSIIDCAKNIRDNDSIFKVATLPSVAEKLAGYMSDYIEIVHRVEASQNAFIKLNELLEDDEEGDESELWTGKFSDLQKLTNMIQEKIEEEYRTMTTSEVEAQLELDKIIRPHDEEIQMETAATAQIPKDPITMKDIRVAVRSNVCGHIYDKEGIEDYFKQKEQAKKTSIRCPQAGCTNKTMSRSELVLDEETNKLIQSS